MSAAEAWPTAAGPESAHLGDQPVAPQVRLVQRVAPRVTLEPLADERISDKGTDLVAISTAGGHDVPDVAMWAYKRAAAQMSTIRPECQIPWTLLAGVGRVESDHGRYGGSVLGADGLPRPAIRGIALDGVGPVAAIPDSDAGRWDDDKVWDRAVGPMQFIPTTWKSAGRDGDDDGVSDPNDIDDAALAAADYLCPSSGSILSDSALNAAIFSYNHSDYYVALVRAFMTGYETGVFDLPSPPPPPVQEEDEETEKDKNGKKDKKGERQKDSEEATLDKAEKAPRRKDGAGTQPKSSPKPPSQSDPKAPPKPKSPPKPKPKPPTSPSPSPTVTPSPTAIGTASPGVAAAPSGG
jgi:hypothetical protein